MLCSCPSSSRGLVDCFLLLLPPAAGDELQGLKKGIVEVADIIAVTKADGPTETLASTTVGEYRGALRLLGCTEHEWKRLVMAISSQTGSGFDDLWAGVQEFFSTQHGEIMSKRSAYLGASFHRLLAHELIARMPQVAQMASLQCRVEQGDYPPATAAFGAAAAITNHLKDKMLPLELEQVIAEANESTALFFSR